eukprot:1985216-Pyramimonas_sp.AAC.1
MRLAEEKDLLRKDGWKLSATPALRNNAGFSAGEWVLAGSHVATAALGGIRQECIDSGKKDPFR